MLTVTELSLWRGGRRVLDSVSFEVAQGSTTAVIGANGAGKSSLIQAIAGLIRPARGSLRYQGRELAGLSSARIADLGIGHVPEGRHLFPTLTVRENLDMGAVIPRARRGRGPRLERILALFPRLAEQIDLDAGALPAGEQQMLAIGRCLMARPDLILFDEPTQGLSPTLARQLFRLIGTLEAEGLTIILAEQNAQAALRLADTAHVLEQGRLIQSGTGLGLLEDPQVRDSYLGL